jgi:hypothetical protein
MAGLVMLGVLAVVAAIDHAYHWIMTAIFGEK